MITHQELKQELKYYPLTGNFNQLTGKQLRMGTFRNIVIKSKGYPKAKIAWLYMTGVYPELDMIFLDGNDRNFKFLNLSVETKTTVDIVHGGDNFKVFIDENNLGVYTEFDEAFEVVKSCLKSMIKK